MRSFASARMSVARACATGMTALVMMAVPMIV